MAEINKDNLNGEAVYEKQCEWFLISTPTLQQASEKANQYN